jgi:hypothetical protein
MGIRLVAPIAVAALAGVLLLAPSPPTAAAVDFDCADFSDQATCVGKSGSSGAPPVRLEMADARRLARKVARQFANSNSHVDTAVLEECKRRGERRVDCLATDRGQSSATETVCRLRVTIRAKNGSPSAKLANSNCRTADILTLSEADALTAMTKTLREITGRPVLIAAIQRLSPSSLTGLGEWTRFSETAGVLQKCSAFLKATRQSASLITVSIDAPECRPPEGALPPPGKGGGGPIY